jgi:hypothetical protein
MPLSARSGNIDYGQMSDFTKLSQWGAGDIVRPRCFYRERKRIYAGLCDARGRGISATLPAVRRGSMLGRD